MTTIKLSNFPWEIQYVEPELTAELIKLFKNEQTSYVRVGPKNFFLPGVYVRNAAGIYNLPIRSSDIFVTNYPRSGSTWTRELVWTVANNFVKTESKLLADRFLFLEYHETFVASSKSKHVMDKNGTVKTYEEAITPNLEPIPGWQIVTKQERESPRFISTHLPLSLLPPNLVDTGKMVYIARDPRDVAVSFYYLSRSHGIFYYEGDFKTYWKLFINNSIYWTPIFEHIKDAWDKRHHPNMLFLFYEELTKDLPAVIRRVARFLNKPYTEEQVADLAEYLKFDNFKKNKLVNLDHRKETGVLKSGEPFIRRGKAGTWHEYFDEEMKQQAEQWMAENLRNTDLRFPDHS